MKGQWTWTSATQPKLDNFSRDFTYRLQS